MMPDVQAKARMPDGGMVTIIMVTYNSEQVVSAALESTTRITWPLQVIVIDNGSVDGTINCLNAASPTAQVIALERNVGFARACNLAVNDAQGKFLLFLNPDTVVLPGAVELAAAHLERNPTIGVVGARTLYEDGTTNITCCFREPSLWSASCHATGLASIFRRSSLFNPEQMGGWQRDDTRTVQVVTGCFLMIKRTLFEKLGGFDERFFLYSEDTDLCRRVRNARLSCVHLSSACIIHTGGGSEPIRSAKLTKVFAARSEYYTKHWSRARAVLGRGLLDIAVLSRLAATRALGRNDSARQWAGVWDTRSEWHQRRTRGWPERRPAALPVAPSLGPDTRLEPDAVRCHLRIAFRLVRHIVRSAKAGYWDFVTQGLQTLCTVPVLMATAPVRPSVYECNVCRWSGSRFYPNTGPGYHEPDTMCPGCLSQDRHRSLLALLASQTTFFQAGTRIVEVAPMRGFEAFVRRQPHLVYTSLDLERRAMERGDITQMRFGDSTVDYFLCFHVPEHVTDHHAALREIRRVLAPGGTAVFQVPLDWDSETTVEYGAPDPRDVGHVRRYGRDFDAILASYGFDIQSLSVVDHFSLESIHRWGLSPEPIFFARRLSDG